MGHPGQLAAAHHADYGQTGSGIHRSASLATPQLKPHIGGPDGVLFVVPPPVTLIIAFPCERHRTRPVAESTEATLLFEEL